MILESEIHYGNPRILQLFNRRVDIKFELAWVLDMKIAIIGGGWTGCHLAISLSKLGHDVTILERNTDIFQGVSGNFGIRLHKGLIILISLSIF